jgi:pimeloyl-ACP methyl ester carboxylesterase
MGVGSPEITKLWREMTGGGRSRPLWPRLVRPGDVVPERKPLAATAPVSPREAVLLPESRRCAAGRLRSFALPQLRTNVESVRTVFCDAGTGPAVVFLQGPGANLTHWAWVAPRLVDRHRVLALDLPGTGESGADGARPSVKRWAAHVGRLLDARGVDRAAVVGHGLGAGVALELALRQPSRVTALALLDPAGLAPPPL